MYKIELDAEKRIIRAIYTPKRTTDGIFIEHLPEAPIDDFKFLDGKLVHDPRTDRPQYDPDAPTEMQILKGIISALAMVTGHMEVLKNVKL